MMYKVAQEHESSIRMHACTDAPRRPPTPTSQLQLVPGEISLRSNMWECRRASVLIAAPPLWCSGNSVTNRVHVLVCVNTRNTPWSSCRSMWCATPPPPLPSLPSPTSPTPTDMEGDGAEPGEYVKQSVGICGLHCSIVEYWTEGVECCWDLDWPSSCRLCFNTNSWLMTLDKKD